MKTNDWLNPILTVAEKETPPKPIPALWLAVFAGIIFLVLLLGVLG